MRGSVGGRRRSVMRAAAVDEAVREAVRRRESVDEGQSVCSTEGTGRQARGGPASVTVLGARMGLGPEGNRHAHMCVETSTHAHTPETETRAPETETRAPETETRAPGTPFMLFDAQQEPSPSQAPQRERLEWSSLLSSFDSGSQGLLCPNYLPTYLPTYLMSTFLWLHPASWLPTCLPALYLPTSRPTILPGPEKAGHVALTRCSRASADTATGDVSRRHARPFASKRHVRPFTSKSQATLRALPLLTLPPSQT
eukprot:2814726-Rhodomonas_salina.1